jgi:hypothetical protein
MLHDRNFNITALLFVIFALSTWIDINGVWAELPLIVRQAPEGWALPSYLNLAVALSNAAPLLIMLLKLIFKQHLDERIFIYIEIIVGIIACGLIAEYWYKTSWFAGTQRSVFFIVFIFLLGTLDTTSAITYADYMKRYNVKLLNVLYFGQSLTSLIPSILISIQGVGGEADCSLNSTQPEYSPPRFSVQVYFWIFALIILLSLVAFLLLEWSAIAQSYRTESFRTPGAYQLSLQADHSAHTLTMSTRMYFFLLVITYCYGHCPLRYSPSDWYLRDVALFSASLLYLEYCLTHRKSALSTHRPFRPKSTATVDHNHRVFCGYMRIRIRSRRGRSQSLSTAARHHGRCYRRHCLLLRGSAVVPLHSFSYRESHSTRVRTGQRTLLARCNYSDGFSVRSHTHVFSC